MSLLIRAAALFLLASLWASTQTVAGAGFSAYAEGRVARRPDQPVLAGRSAFADRPGETSPKREREGGQAGAPAKPAAEASGKELLTRKCFQCHQASMWSSLRQDRKEWEGVLYRMVGRGALWTEAEINAMADFLAQTRGTK